MTLPPAVADLVSAWSSYYSDHQLVSVSVRYLHLAGTVVGGGAALSLDRDVLRSMHADAPNRRAALARLQGAHRVVVPALTVMAVTGVLMTAADLSTFLDSNLFWIKIGLVVALTLNGGVLLAAEVSAARSDGASGWGRLAVLAGLSIALWLVTLFVGTWLPVAA